MNITIDRPPGLIIVVIVTAVIAVPDIIVYGIGLFGVIIGNMEAETSVTILIGFVLSMAMAVTAHRLWYFERWAHRLAQIVYVAYIIGTVSAIAVGEGTGLHFFLLLLLIWTLFYVSTKRTRTLYVGKSFGVSDDPSKDTEPVLRPRDRFFS